MYTQDCPARRARFLLGAAEGVPRLRGRAGRRGRGQDGDGAAVARLRRRARLRKSHPERIQPEIIRKITCYSVWPRDAIDATSPVTSLLDGVEGWRVA